MQDAERNEAQSRAANPLPKRLCGKCPRQESNLRTRFRKLEFHRRSIWASRAASHDSLRRCRGAAHAGILSWSHTGRSRRDRPSPATLTIFADDPLQPTISSRLPANCSRRSPPVWARGTPAREGDVTESLMGAPHMMLGRDIRFRTPSRLPLDHLRSPEMGANGVPSSPVTALSSQRVCRRTDRQSEPSWLATHYRYRQ